jgi:hypothetical protein
VRYSAHFQSLHGARRLVFERIAQQRANRNIHPLELASVVLAETERSPRRSRARLRAELSRLLAIRGPYNPVG